MFWDHCSKLQQTIRTKTKARGSKNFGEKSAWQTVMLKVWRSSRKEQWGGGSAAGRRQGGQRQPQAKSKLACKDMHGTATHLADEGATTNNTLVIYHRYIGSALLTPLGVSWASQKGDIRCAGHHQSSKFRPLRKNTYQLHFGSNPRIMWHGHDADAPPPLSRQRELLLLGGGELWPRLAQPV